MLLKHDQYPGETNELWQNLAANGSDRSVPADGHCIWTGTIWVADMSVDPVAVI